MDQKLLNPGVVPDCVLLSNHESSRIFSSYLEAHKCPYISAMYMSMTFLLIGCKIDTYTEDSGKRMIVYSNDSLYSHYEK